MDLRTRPLCLIFLILMGCHTGEPAPAPVVANLQTGIASWYGDPFDGKPTASGETFNKNTLTAAHRTLEFGTVVRVNDLQNQKTIDVRINDRGPFVQDRIIDLAEAAARDIDVAGTANVRLEILSTPPQRALSNFAVQVAMLQDHAAALRLRQSLESQYGSASLALRAGMPPLWRVMVGMEPTEAAAEKLALRVVDQGSGRFVVRIDTQ